MSSSQQPQPTQQPQPLQPTQPTQQPVPQPAQPQQNKNIWWIVGLVGLIVLGVIVVFALFGGEDAPAGPEVTPPPPAPGVPSAMALEAVNIRSGPSTAYPSYGVAPAGSSGEVMGVSEDRQWWVIKLPTSVASTGQGWVAGEYVQVSNAETVPVIPTPPLPPIIVIPPPPSNGPTAVALDVVYIRSGPGVEYPAYGLAAKDAKGEVIGVSEDGLWWVIKLPTTVAPDGQGWVSADWVATSNTENVPVIAAPGQQPPANLPPPATGAPTAVALDYVNVRSGPGEEYDIYGVVPPGASGEILGKSQDGRWWAVKAPSVASGRGWVSVDYVQAYNADQVPVLTEP